jgi:predicted dehydrogenase
MSDPRRVLIVGCGELGSRHLQAVITLPSVDEIEIVDPSPERLQVGRQRADEVPERRESISLRWLPSLEEASSTGDLCIVATQADVRCDVVRQVTEQLSYSSFLLEKIVAQSLSDYEALRGFAQTRNLAVWVNCKTRVHASHRAVKANLDPEEPITLTVSGGNHGLANNGLHFADLFAFYDGADHIESAGSWIDPVLHTTKRGPEILDLSGSLQGFTNKGSRFFLSFTREHLSPPCISVVSSEYRAMVDDVAKVFYESSAEFDWVWTPVPFSANLSVSYMTREFARDILASGQCALPTLEECYAGHEFILTSLQPHFSRLQGAELDRLPVT